MKNVYKSFVSEYPIVSMEDPFDQDDWVHYAKMTEEIGDQVQIVGDDLLVTNPTVSFLFLFCHEMINFNFVGQFIIINDPLFFRGLQRLSRRSHAMLFCSRYLSYPSFFPVLYYYGKQSRPWDPCGTVEREKYLAD